MSRHVTRFARQVALRNEIALRNAERMTDEVLTHILL